MCGDKYKNKDVKIKGMATALDKGSHTVFGESAEASTKFNGNTATAELAFSSEQIKNSGVFKRDIILNWKIQCEGKIFEPKTNHRIYIILQKPTEPWGNRALWIRALDHACWWAQGKKNEDDAASAITNYANSNLNLLYVDGPHYTANKTMEYFHCGEFITDIDAAKPYIAVNCYTCANIVCSFANMLGCNLSTFEFPKENVPLDSNAVKLVGCPEDSKYVYVIGTDSKWTYSPTDKLDNNNKKLYLAKATNGISFGTHSIAFKDNMLSLERGKNMPDDARIYDACLRYIADGKEILPANMKFGEYCKNAFQYVVGIQSIMWIGRSVLTV